MHRGKIYIISSIIVSIVAILVVFITLAATGVIRTDVRNITLVSESYSRQYDGTPLKYQVASLNGRLYSGDKVEYVFTGEITDVGNIDNTFSAKVVDSKGNDVSNSYKINYVFGKLSVLSRTIQMNVKSISKFYDGIPLSVNEEFDIIDNNYKSDLVLSLSGSPIIKGHTISGSINGVVNEYGQKEEMNLIYDVFDSNNNNITKNYNVILKSANSIDKPTLEIKRYPLEIKTISYEKEYDGLPLVGSELLGNSYEISKGQLYDGDSISVDFNGLVNNFGQGLNSIKATILDLEGNDVTLKYDITYLFGDLEISKRELELMYNDEVEYTNTEAMLNFDNVKIKEVNFFDSSKFVVTGDVSYASSDSHILPGDYLIDISNVSIYDLLGNDVSEFFRISNSENSKLTVKKIPLSFTFYPLTTEVYYDSYNHPLTISNYEISGDLLEGYNNISLNFKDENGKSIKEFINAGYYKNLEVVPIVLNDEGKNVSNLYEYIFTNETNYEILPYEICDFSFSLTSNESEYTGSEQILTDDMLVVNGNPTLISGDRIAYSLLPNAIIKNIKDYDIRVLIKVYNSDNKDVTSNYTYDKSIASVIYSVVPIKLEVEKKLSDISVVYDGLSHEQDVKTSLELTDSSKNKLLDGHNVDFKFSEGSKKANYINAGVHNYDVEIRVFSNMLDVSEFYTIDDTTLLFVIEKRVLHITSNSITKRDNNEPLTSTNNDITITYGSLVSGHEISYHKFASLNNVGKISNTFAVENVIDSNGVDVTNNYSFSLYYGFLELLEKVIIDSVQIRLRTINKLYDGNPYSGSKPGIYLDNHSDYTIDINSTYEVNIPTDVNIGTYYTEIVNLDGIIIKDSKGEDVTDMLDITISKGRLVIGMAEITISGMNQIFTYDGEEHFIDKDFDNNTNISVNSNISGFSIDDYNIIFNSSIENTSITDAGMLINAFDVKIYDSLGKDVTRMFVVVYKPGVVIVNPKVITLTSITSQYNEDKSYQKLIYDGNTYSIDELCDYLGLDLEIEFKSSSAGENIFEIKNSTKFTNYKFILNYGELT